MALLALRAQTALMDIVCGVTAIAAALKTSGCRRCVAMAFVAIHLAVCAVQRESGLAMIEVPGFPGACVMAAVAFDAEAPAMFVILFMATIAGLRCVMERWRQVALLALDLAMTACERET